MLLSLLRDLTELMSGIDNMGDGNVFDSQAYITETYVGYML